MFLPQLPEFLQTKIKQIDQSRYIAPSLVCVQHDKTCRSSSQREKDGDRYLWSALRAGTCHINCLWVLWESAKQPPYNLINFIRKLLAKDFHTCKDHQVWTDCNPKETSLPQSVLRGSDSRPPHANFTSQKGETGATSWRRGCLHFFSFSFKHLWKGNNFSVLHRL